MAQSEIQVTTTPPLPGTQLVNEINDALETIATDFSGATDPAADAFAYSLWADTNTGDLKRRNAANSAWVTIGRIYPAITELSNGNVGIGTATPATDLDVVGSAGITSFTGTTKLGIAVRGSTAANDYSGIDFYGNSQANPTARVAVITTGSGSSLTFGTSNAYGSGITNAAMTINDDGIVGVGTTNPTDNVGYGAAVDIQGSLGGAVYLRDRDNPSLYTYLAFTGSNSTTYIWNVATGAMLFGTNDAERMRIASGGAVSIGKSVDTVTGAGIVLDPSGLIRITRTGTTSATHVQFANNGGTQVGLISTSGSTTTYSTSSDYRLKDNVAPMEGALEKIAALKPVTYTWKNDGNVGQGFIAHELQAVVPDCVTGAKDAVDADGNPEYQGVDTSYLVATLVAAIQELKAEFDAYKAAHP